MAELRIPPASVPATRPAAAPARVDAARAAQRAFFQAAAGDTTPAPPATAQAPSVDTGTGPQRLLRPGSLLDIKV